MAIPVVFVDTNCLDNRGSATTFLGNRTELEKISKRARIILPKVVYDELSKHVRAYLGAQVDALRRNPHRHHLGISDDQIDTLNIDEQLQRLITEEPIKFEILELKDMRAAYDAAYQHSIDGTPPFETSGDKGFKDTLIAKTIDEFIKGTEEGIVYLMVKDGKLKEYFAQNPRVITIADYNDFDKDYSEDKLDSYLLDRVQNYLEENANVTTKSELKRHWLNWDGDIIGEFASTKGTYLVRIDSANREPIDYTTGSPIACLLELEGTSNFSLAHDSVASLDALLNFLSIEHAEHAYKVLVKNDQIYKIGQDPDIRQTADSFSNILSGFSMRTEVEHIRKLYRLEEKQDDLDDEYEDYLDSLADYAAEMQADIERGR